MLYISLLLPLILLAPRVLSDNPQDSTGVPPYSYSNSYCVTAGPTATVAYEPCYSYHSTASSTVNEGCPQNAQLDIHFHNEDNFGCCTQSATLTTASGLLACCPCGAICTGAVPSMVDWSFVAGAMVTTNAPQTVSTTPVTMSPSSRLATTTTASRSTSSASSSAGSSSSSGSVGKSTGSTTQATSTSGSTSAVSSALSSSAAQATTSGSITGVRLTPYALGGQALVIAALLAYFIA
ncbi:hypothetical protein K432DRAFT_378012 [Lepidopterella palustris CBS 459.81]|uniref:Uncharacterized protein n=1 Tax=Lepidopterella palustris CBS 459.81 TaxID=1314670 RepID=A0A8E2JJJ3_9PEZI|nr:hypothetical protein K432DRAFT_378012 [Lepidopterella palustris CBS 459.81]